MKLSGTPTTSAQAALDYLEDAWAYFCPAPVETTSEEQEPDLFQYANAA